MGQKWMTFFVKKGSSFELEYFNVILKQVLIFDCDNVTESENFQLEKLFLNFT